ETRAAAVVDSLIADHVRNEQVGEVLDRPMNEPSPAWEKLLRAVLAKSPRRKVQGLACFRLGQYLKVLAQRRQHLQDDPELGELQERYYGREVMKHVRARTVQGLTREAERLLKRVHTRYADVRCPPNLSGEVDAKTLGRAAEGELFKIRHLTIGKV